MFQVLLDRRGQLFIRRLGPLAPVQHLDDMQAEPGVNKARMHADANAFVGRKQRKRHFRRLWTQRINAAVRQHGLSYSKFIHGLKKSGIEMNRKVLADLAVHEPAVFQALVEAANKGLSA